MASHKKVSGFRITLGAGGLRFTKRASGYNTCIGQRLKNQRHPGIGRASKTNAKGSAFLSAVAACRRGG